jgi:hypothetical protein
LETDDPLWSAIRAAHLRWSPDAAERFTPNFRWEPLGHEVGTAQPLMQQGVAGAVHTVPTVHTEKHKTEHRTRAEARAAWEERAAILEYEGGLSRCEAEGQAAAELGFTPS